MNPRKSGSCGKQNVGCTGFFLVLSSLPVGCRFEFRLPYSYTLVNAKFVSIFLDSFVTSLFGRTLWFAFVCMGSLTSMHLFACTLPVRTFKSEVDFKACRTGLFDNFPFFICIFSFLIFFNYNCAFLFLFFSLVDHVVRFLILFYPLAYRLSVYGSSLWGLDQ